MPDFYWIFRINSQRMSAVIYFFHFLSPDSREIPRFFNRLLATGTSIDFEVAMLRRSGSRDRVTRNLSILLANKTRGSSLISTVFTGQPADVTRARLCIASHRRCIMRVWLHIPRRVREQKGWNAPALSFLSPRVARILINGGETLRHSAAARAAEMN